MTYDELMITDKKAVEEIDKFMVEKRTESDHEQ